MYRNIPERPNPTSIKREKAAIALVDDFRLCIDDPNISDLSVKTANTISSCWHTIKIPPSIIPTEILVFSLLMTWNPK